MGLMTGKDLGHGEVLKVLMIRDHINQDTRTFRVVPPNTESLKDCKEFLVVSVVIELWCHKGAGVKGHRVDLTGVSLNGECYDFEQLKQLLTVAFHKEVAFRVKV